ncbi:rCG59323 [Rattus norvegicus]|uniref:RCG59323 n=1 Tax=Rattus norvegicus TaxID=10116 RepID=A6K7P7_RAT|nr:rCG59323 [Rattus norvegicus]
MPNESHRCCFFSELRSSLPNTCTSLTVPGPWREIWSQLLQSLSARCHASCHDDNRLNL